MIVKVAVLNVRPGAHAEFEAAGIDTVAELANRNAANLHETLAQTNAAQKCVRQLPAASRVADWVKQAKKLKRLVSYQFARTTREPEEQK